MTDVTALDTKGYYDTLSKQDKERFEKQFNKTRRNIDFESAKSQAENVFNRRHVEHLRLVEDIASGFDPADNVETNEGFEFVATDPLCETTRTEADVLLVNADYNYVYPCIIFCETEAERSGEWVAHVNEASKVFNESRNQDKLLLQIERPGKEVGGIQYAILTRSQDYRRVDFQELATNCEVEFVSLWVSSRWEQELWHEEGQLVHQQLGERLEDKIDSGLSNIEINYKIGSHPVLSLRQVLFEIIDGAADSDEYPLEFNRRDFAESFEGGLQILSSGNERDELVESEVNRLLKTGNEIGILSDKGDRINSDRDFRIVFSGGSGPEDAKRATEEKYIDTKSEEEADVIAFRRTKNQFDPKDSTDLDEFT